MSALATRFMWQASSGSAAPIVDTTLTVVKAAPTAADLANGSGSTLALTDLEIVNTNATNATLVNVISGAATVIATFYLPAVTAALAAVPVQRSFATPLIVPKGNNISLQAVTTGAALYWNARGFTFNS